MGLMVLASVPQYQQDCTNLPHWPLDQALDLYQEEEVQFLNNKLHHFFKHLSSFPQLSLCSQCTRWILSLRAQMSIGIPGYHKRVN